MDGAMSEYYRIVQLILMFGWQGSLTWPEPFQHITQQIEISPLISMASEELC